MTRDSKSLAWLSSITLVLGSLSLAGAFPGLRSHGAETQLMFWSLLSLGLAVTSCCFALPLSRQHGMAWVLLALGAVLGLLAIRSFAFAILRG